jgi:hypothetical protein
LSLPTERGKNSEETDKSNVFGFGLEMNEEWKMREPRRKMNVEGKGRES